ncbi:hypothetical protein NEOLEDRAFT_335909 [Neolentinus lepideus HHB14362 ss-1]|uniref:Malate dehydrogenase n=1 Tax=Neolentinus lepideus HHB14362 ss-1 TaxID=1314782 RepID=A0A165SV04_9AGAM|nr:hypothetical protein NEOLEDRAFT_335909 [Neolentinus lepideus HHB14362 ss-1]
MGIYNAYFGMHSPLSFAVVSGSTAHRVSEPSVRCNVAHDALHLPANQTQLFKPNATLSYLALAVGVQNYTCSNTSTWTNTGAVADLLDISCLYNTPLFDTLASIVYGAWNNTPDAVTPLEMNRALSGNPEVLGQHYYVPNPAGSGTSPKWDFTSASYKGDPNAFVVGAKVGDLPAPMSKADIDWVQLRATEGELATVVYRVQTKGGQPPSSCTPGSPLLSVKYTSQYWFYGSSLKKQHETGEL